MARNPYSGQIFSDLISGNLFQADQITGPFICIVGTASSGPTYTLKRISSAQQAASLFEDGGDTDTTFLRDISLALEEGGDAVTLYAMRIGGRKGSQLFTQSATNATLTLEPAYEDAEVMSKYKICFLQDSASSGKQRILVYDDDLDAVIYDNEFIIVPDLGLIKVDLHKDWAGYYEIGLDTNGQPDFENSAPTLEELYNGAGTTYFTVAQHSSTNTVAATSEEAAADGKVLSRAEYFACLQKAYGLISTRYMDYIVPSGVYFDDPNITDTEDGRDQSHPSASAVYNPSDIDWSSGAVDRDADGDILGYAWQYRYKGSTYTMMSTISDLFSGSSTIDDIVNIGGTRGAADATFKYAPGGTPSASATVEVAWADLKKLAVIKSAGKWYKVKQIKLDIVNSPNDADGIVHNQTTTGHLDESFDTSTLVLTLRAAFDVTNYAATIPFAKIKDLLEASEYIDSVKIYDSAGAEVTSNLVNADYFHTLSDYTGTAIDLAKYWLTHKELAGEDVPDRVWQKFQEGTDPQLREVNFGHQLAQFCYYASTSYHMCLGFISFSKPNSFVKTDLADYMGSLPEYQGWGGKLNNEAIKSVGEGILGNKFLSGSLSYRHAQLKSASSSQGYAYGGLICTKGLALPNQEPYGISQGDEKKDINEMPVDIGRHIIVCASWPVCSFTLSGVTTSDRHSIAALLAAKVFVTPVNQEPFGEVNGRVRSALTLSDSELQLVSDGYAGDCRIARITLLDQSAIGGSTYITNISTAAHWIDDYKRISTIRCVNRVVNGLRNLAKRYIGSSFSAAMITSLQTAINGYLKAEQDVGVHQGALATLSYTRADRINGNLKIRLKMVPPFALETITITTSVAADASEI